MIHKPALTALSACAALAVGVSALSLPASASTNKTATFLVSLTVQSDCSISAADLSFGSANSSLATTAITQSSNLTVTCSTGTGYTLSLDKGSTTGSSVTGRLLAGTGGNTQTVQYQLYSDALRTTIWGDATGGSTVTRTGTGSAETIPVYGTVPAQTIPLADNYSSTETATITF
jgi:spore coat protein U-like protein